MTAERQVRNRAREQTKPSPIDLHVGRRVRERRVGLGMSQPELSAKIGVAHAQLQKYEGGVNRVSAGRLFMISRALEVPVDYFFEGI